MLSILKWYGVVYYNRSKECFSMKLCRTLLNDVHWFWYLPSLKKRNSLWRLVSTIYIFWISPSQYVFAQRCLYRRSTSTGSLLWWESQLMATLSIFVLINFCLPSHDTQTSLTPFEQRELSKRNPKYPKTGPRMYLYNKYRCIKNHQLEVTISSSKLLLGVTTARRTKGKRWMNQAAIFRTGVLHNLENSNTIGIDWLSIPCSRWGVCHPLSKSRPFREIWSLATLAISVNLVEI